MRFQLLLSVLLLSICGQSSPVAPVEQESSLERRAGVVKHSVVATWPVKQDDRSVNPIPYCVKGSNPGYEAQIKGAIKQAAGLWTNPPRGVHTMEIGRDVLDGEYGALVGRLAHELGRNIGLPNDNQLDPSFYSISCSNVNGFDKSQKSKYKAACNDYAKAKELGWKEGMNIGPLAENDFLKATGPLSKFRHNLQWDDRSIMRMPKTAYGRKSSMGFYYSTVPLKSSLPTINLNWADFATGGPTLYDLQAVVEMYPSARVAAALLQGLARDVADANLPPSYEECEMPAVAAPAYDDQNTFPVDQPI
ncbi:hypothetical protein NUU61_008277 [Penicillium alfredii]|uniref:Uncharacterized protein n=1 Tax=Penicillium alfredii TaxID=1506179 RepID=A0A9W9JZ91_9EURO|nr:uncharacterized protein NUU61_008277 [Penicillium alfredii]KAJ5086970.1 hypothetical protein NUU61_008277 [Penicillium alfredii]